MTRADLALLAGLLVGAAILLAASAALGRPVEGGTAEEQPPAGWCRCP